MKLNQKDWSCPKKQNARFETISKQYREHFTNSLPEEKQYWTMCGQCSTPTGEPLDGSEPIQMLNEGLIVPEQFRGVEVNSAIHESNSKALPELTFINDDFYRAMTTAAHEGRFNPGVVNADFPATPSSSTAYVAKIMALLTATASDLILVINMILRMRYYKRKDGDFIINRMNKYASFRHAWEHGNWELGDEYFEYNGAGNTGSRTYMGSLIFIKK